MADLAITPANVFASQQATVEFGIAGVAIVAGQSLYKDTADSNKMKLADSDGAGDMKVFAGIALHQAALNQPIKYATKDPAFIPGTALLGGDTIWQSETPGGISKTFADFDAGDYITVLGVAISTTVMNLNPIVGAVRT